MKKLLVLLLVVVFVCSAFASCEYLPDEVVDTISPVLDKIGLSDLLGGESEHEHVFELTKEKKPTCVTDGTLTYTCECGETKKEAGAPATGHTMVVAYSQEPTCFADGSVRRKCSVCGISESETLPATGEHVYDESTEASRIIRCSNTPCASCKIREFSGKYTEQMVYVFSESDLEAFYAIFNDLESFIAAAEPYDPALHAYDESSALYEASLVLEDKYEVLYDHLKFVIAQQQLAQVEYYCDMDNATKKDNVDYISKIRTELVSKFYSFSEPIYNSMYREYYYYGMTEQEILSFLLESNTVADPEFKAVLDRINEIDLEFSAIADPTSSMLVLDLYAELVENNNKLADMLGYENYLEYAYNDVYDRDYSYQDVQLVAEYVKEYIAPVYVTVHDSWNTLASSGKFTQGDIDSYYHQVSDSFFEVYESNVHLNNYIDLLVLDSNPDRVISFSDELNSLISEGNLFRGDYQGAYETYLYSLEVPLVYFGEGYNSPFTVVHEFGHYMNDIYSQNKVSQSYDLLEMHSQGNEILYLSYLNGKIGKTAYSLVENYQLVVYLNTVIVALAVDTFEQAVYLDYYEGTYAEEIMADGTITSDEYDLLFNSVIEDFGVSGYVNEGYWRYATISSPCYYVSYSVSALSVLQLYPMANENMDAAIDSYLKLYTYVDELDEDEYMTTEEVLLYAGLYSFNDEELYKYIAERIWNK